MWKFHADWSNSRLPALMTDVIAQWTKESNRKAVNRRRMMEKTGRGIIVKIRLVLFIRRNLCNFHILYHPNFSNNPPFFFSSFFSFSSRGEKRVFAILLKHADSTRFLPRWKSVYAYFQAIFFFESCIRTIVARKHSATRIYEKETDR